MLGVENLVKGFVMPLRTGKTGEEPVEKGSLMRRIHHRLHSDPSMAADPAALYRLALSDLVDSWLKDRRLGSPSAEQAGEAYERLRGFRLDLSAEGEIRLVTTALGKRNQGLFYTPRTIVRNIVASTLDALEISSASHYPALKILDPSVGVGTFLVEALEQVTARALGRVPPMDGFGPEPTEVALCREAGVPGSAQEQGIRRHVLENCLYGLDLDDTAVSIARAALAERLSGEAGSGTLNDHLRCGNSLMGATWREAIPCSREELDKIHREAYWGKRVPAGMDVREWGRDKGMFHWPLEFPDVAAAPHAGFDAIIGNPPYEIMSVKESGIEERHREQRYFRRMYRTCSGKINTYRLMLERGLDLLAEGGVLGFIVPATLLADSTAAPLRKMILDGFSICRCVAIPERARAFQGVTQAFVIVVVRKDGGSGAVFPVAWDGTGAMPSAGPVEISRTLIDSLGLRIPVLKSHEDKGLLERLSRFPQFRGDESVAAAGQVHQGEVNLTVHRHCITSQRTPYPLIRGEHVYPFRTEHPTPGKARLDWIRPECVPEQPVAQGKQGKRSQERPGNGRAIRGDSWQKERIVVGRVVNMDTVRRLKAAPVRKGSFLGDMTNSISELTVPGDYLLGLLNSRLLNWRFKLTSTNSYISAAEIESLPIPRPGWKALSSRERSLIEERLESLLAQWPESIEQGTVACTKCFDEELNSLGVAFTAKVIEVVAGRVTALTLERGVYPEDLAMVLDSMVLLLYGVESAAGRI